MAKAPPKPTDSELEILHVLWQHGPTTVRTVNEQLSQHREVGGGADTTAVLGAAAE